MTFWVCWVIATFVGSFVALVAGLILVWPASWLRWKFLLNISELEFPEFWVLTFLTVPLAQWLVMRQLTTFSLAWVPIYFVSSVIGYSVGLGTRAMIDIHFVGFILSAAVSGLVIGLIQCPIVPRLFSLVAPVGRSLSYKWLLSTMVGFILGYAIYLLALVVSSALFHDGLLVFVIMPMLVLTVVAICQGHILQGQIDLKEGLQAPNG